MLFFVPDTVVYDVRHVTYPYSTQSAMAHARDCTLQCHVDQPVEVPRAVASTLGTDRQTDDALV